MTYGTGSPGQPDEPAVRSPSATLASAQNELAPAMPMAPAAGADKVTSEIERETPPPSAHDVAERVYRLFCEDLRRGRERRGY